MTKLFEVYKCERLREHRDGSRSIRRHYGVLREADGPPAGKDH